MADKIENVFGSEEFSLKLVKWKGEKGPPINLAWGPDNLIRPCPYRPPLGGPLSPAKNDMSEMRRPGNGYDRVGFKNFVGLYSSLSACNERVAFVLSRL